MPFIDTVKRINVDEFKKEDRDTVERIAEIYNYFAEQVTDTINGNLDFDNLNRSVLSLEVSVLSTGKPVNELKFSAKVGLVGTKVLRAENLTNAAIYPSGCPFLSFSASGSGIYTVTNITGLQAGNKYRLTIELVF